MKAESQMSNVCSTHIDIDLLKNLAETLRLAAPELTISTLSEMCELVGVRGHLAILFEPFVSKILDGTKTIESRFHRVRCAPFGQVRDGDILFLKVTSGPLVALAIVTDVMYFGPLCEGDAA